MSDTSGSLGYEWADAELSDAHDFLLPELKRVLTTHANPARERRLFDLGCGNGAVANELVKLGWSVQGVDASPQGIAQANSRYPHIPLYLGSAYDELAAAYQTFPIVISLEVVEHVYDPRLYASTLYSLVESGGLAVVSTPYHGYWKNLALAITGKMDAHFTALWDHGHIKFWSAQTLTQLLKEAGFVNIEFRRVGRIPPLAKSMIALARKP